jgi:hypothetical protein
LPTGALLHRVRDLGLAQDWPAIRDLLSPPPERPMPALLPRALEAALLLDDAPLRDWATQAAIDWSMPHRLRAMLARQFAGAGHAATAWAVLAADPGTVWDIEARRLVASVLAVIWLDAAAPDPLRCAARALERRLAGAGETEPPVAPFVLPVDPPVAPPAHPLTVIAAPGVDPAVPAAIARLTAEHEADLAAAEHPVLRVFEDVYVNAGGQVWRADGRMLAGGAGGLPPEARAAMALAPRIAAGILATGPTNNLYHWLGAWLPGLAWRFAPGVPAGLPVLIRDDAAPYQTEGLALAFGADLPVLPVGAAMHVRRLYRLDRHPLRLDPLSAQQAVIGRVLAAAAAQVPVPAGGGARLYLSRRDARQRRLGNEAAVEEALAALGFVALTMAGRPLAEQLRLVAQAEAIVAPHGAALTLLLAARPGTAVFELLPAMPRSLPVRLCMSRISRARGLRHLLRVEPCDELREQWRCDIGAVVPALEAFLAGR